MTDIAVGSRYGQQDVGDYCGRHAMTVINELADESRRRGYPAAVLIEHIGARTPWG